MIWHASVTDEISHIYKTIISSLVDYTSLLTARATNYKMLNRSLIA